jgi:predicted MPP superfamily phosphohydrolase
MALKAQGRSDQSPPAKPGKATSQPVVQSEPAQPEKAAPAASQPSEPASAAPEGDRPILQAPAKAAATEDLPFAVVQEPSQGRPIFIVPGETFFAVMRWPSTAAEDVSFSLQHAMEPSIRIRLKPTTPPAWVDEYCKLVLMVPPETPPGLYDVEVRRPTTTHYSRRCIRVVDAYKTKFRFVHLSNMNIGDPTAPDFDEMLPQEINLLAPEFIIATGDYTEWANIMDDATSWLRVLKFFEKFNAPVFMLCGAQDHQASFTRLVASQMMGPLDYGNYHGLLLLDHPGNQIDQDYEQLQWVQSDLKRNRNKRFNFIATNSDELALLDIWRENGNLEQFIKDNHIRLFITGGSADWDFREFADKIKGLADFHLIRTHESSTSLRDMASGFSHYRVVEVDGDKISYTYPNDTACGEKTQFSIPTGRLRTFYDGANDGTATRVIATVQNALNQGFDEVHLWLRLAKGPGNVKPAVSPGRIAQMLDVDGYWACDVVVDVPDKGGVRVMAASDPAAVPAEPPIEVQLQGPTDWTFVAQRTNFGMAYNTCDAKVSLKLTNTGKAAQSCWPVVRVNGGQLHPDRAACPRLPLMLEPGKSIEVPLVLNLRRVSPGKHALQVYFLEDPLNRIRTFDVTLKWIGEGRSDAHTIP